MNTPGVRDLVVPVVIVLGLSRFVEGAPAWIVAALLTLAVALGVLQLIADATPGAQHVGVPVESLLLPAAAAFAAFAALRLVPVSALIVPAILVVAVLVLRTTTTELRLATSTTPPSATDRTRVLAESLVVALFAFLGVAALVPGGFPDPAGGASGITGRGLLELAVADAGIAALLGYRIAALQTSSVRDVVWAATRTGIAVGIAAVVLRELGVPRLAGPALLVLVLFLWHAAHGTAGEGRRRRRGWETALLLLLGAAVVGWSLVGRA